MTDWVDAVEEIDQDTVDTQGPEYPYIQWVNGKRELKSAGGVVYTGGWFMPASQVEAGTLPGWDAGELVHRSGGSTDGFFRRDLTVAIIRNRHCWVVNVGDDYQLFPWQQYDEAKRAGKPTGKLQSLVLVKDLEGLGAIILTMKGSISRAFAPSRRGDSVMNVFHRCVIAEANKLVIRKNGKAPGKFPYRAFWLTVGPERVADGTPTYTTVGSGASSSPVTLPTALDLAEHMDKAALGALFVGRETLEWVNELYRDAEAWATAWDTLEQREPVVAMATPVEDDDEGEVPF